MGLKYTLWQEGNGDEDETFRDRRNKPGFSSPKDLD